VAVALAAACSLALLASTAQAGPPGRWTQITQQHKGALANLGLARGKDRTLHVLWAGPGRAPYTGIFDTPISPAGAVGKPVTVLSGWSGVNPPTAATAPDGSIHAIVSGAKVGTIDDPTSGLTEAVGPGGWTLAPQAFGNSPITVAANADVYSAFLPSGEIVSVWRSAASLLFQVGANPAVAPQVITPPALAVNPVIAVDQASGDAIIAYHGVNDGQNSPASAARRGRCPCRRAHAS
jgi:hypothetical protein